MGPRDRDAATAGREAARLPACRGGALRRRQRRRAASSSSSPARAGWRHCAAPTRTPNTSARGEAAEAPIYGLDGRWPLIATSVSRLRAEGHLAAVWERLDERAAPPMALTDLPVRGDMEPVDLSRTLGRRWRKDDPDFWRRLSPLGTGGYSTASSQRRSCRASRSRCRARVRRLHQAASALARSAPGRGPSRLRGPQRRRRARRTCVCRRSMAPWTTAKTTSRRGHGSDARLPLHAHLDRRGEPAHLAALAARTAGGVLQGAGGLADRRPPGGPGDRHEARPARPAGRARPRPRRPRSICCSSTASTGSRARCASSPSSPRSSTRSSVVLRSATEPFDTGSAAGRMMLQMLAVFAEFEHATIVDRVTAGIERRAKEGRWSAGRLPFGYRRSTSRSARPRPAKAPVVTPDLRPLHARAGSARAAIARAARRRARARASPPAGDTRRRAAGSSTTRPT